MSDAEGLTVLKLIDKKMDYVKKIITLGLIKGLDENDAIQTLMKLDMKYTEIGTYLGLSGNAVKMRVRNMKKDKKYDK